MREGSERSSVLPGVAALCLLTSALVAGAWWSLRVEGLVPPPEPDAPLAGDGVGSRAGFDDPARVTIDGGDLLVDGRPLGVLRCVSFQPVPVGRSAGHGYAWASDAAVFEGDLPRLRAMGANALAVNARSGASSEELAGFMAAALEEGLRTILVVDGPVNASDPASVAVFLRTVSDVVQAHRGHPGLLMWQLGVEVDYQYAGDVRDWFAVLERGLALVERLDPLHPAFTSTNPATSDRVVVAEAPSLPIFGVNFYAVDEEEVASYLPRLASRVNRSVLVTEFGADAWDSRAQTEDEETQASAILAQWRGIARARAAGAPVLGGCLHEWVDQWWKDGQARLQSTRADWRPAKLGVLPDDSYSEEWFGIARNDGLAGDRSLRLAYLRLAEEWRAFGPVKPEPGVGR